MKFYFCLIVLSSKTTKLCLKSKQIVALKSAFVSPAPENYLTSKLAKDTILTKKAKEESETCARALLCPRVILPVF